MRKKIFGLVVIFLITGSFVLSAAPATEGAKSVDPDAPRGEAVYAADYYGGMSPDPHYAFHGAANTITHPVNGVSQMMQQDPTNASTSPGMALSWEISSDLKTWTFEIRQGVKFPMTGNPVTAHDYVYSDNKIMTGYADAGFTAMRNVVIDDMRAEGDYTLVVRLNSASVLFGPMSSVYGARGLGFAVDSKYCEEVGYERFKEVPSTLGWFLGTETKLGEYVILEAPDDAVYPWANPPRAGVKKITMLLVPEPMTRLAMLRTGQIDIMGGVRGPAIPEADRDRRIGIAASPPAAIRELVLTEMKYMDVPHPVHDVRVREALSHAIDREAIIDRLYYGYAQPATIPSVVGFIPGGDPTIPGWEYDPDKARALLVEAGYPNGFKYKISVLPAFSDLALAIQGYFADIGVDVEIVPVEAATLTRSFSEKTIRGIAITPCSVRAEPVVMNAHYYEIDASWSWSVDPELDATIKDILATPDAEERYAKQREYSWMLYEKLPRIPIVNELYVYALGPRVDRFVPGIHFAWNHAEWLTLKD